MRDFPPIPRQRGNGAAAVSQVLPAAPRRPEPPVLTHAKTATPPAGAPGWSDERRGAWLAWIDWLRAEAERRNRYLPSVAVVMTTWSGMRATIQANARREKDAFDAWLAEARRLKATDAPDSHIPDRPLTPCIALESLYARLQARESQGMPSYALDADLFCVCVMAYRRLLDLARA